MSACAVCRPAGGATCRETPCACACHPAAMREHARAAGIVATPCPRCGAGCETTTAAYLIGPDRNRATCHACGWVGQAHECIAPKLTIERAPVGELERLREIETCARVFLGARDAFGAAAFSAQHTDPPCAACAKLRSLGDNSDQCAAELRAALEPEPKARPNAASEAWSTSAFRVSPETLAGIEARARIFSERLVFAHIRAIEGELAEARAARDALWRHLADVAQALGYTRAVSPGPYPGEVAIVALCEYARELRRESESVLAVELAAARRDLLNATRALSRLEIGRERLHRIEDAARALATSGLLAELAEEVDDEDREVLEALSRALGEDPT